MKLTDLDPTFFGYGGQGVYQDGGEPVPRREGVGLMCQCPCGNCDPESGWLAIDFLNPLDGGPPIKTDASPSWHRTGETFETLTLSPSILRSKDKGGCGWHGWIRDGEVISC